MKETFVEIGDMEKECILGLITQHTLVHSTWTRKKDTESSRFQIPTNSRFVFTIEFM